MLTHVARQGYGTGAVIYVINISSTEQVTTAISLGERVYEAAVTLLRRAADNSTKPIPLFTANCVSPDLLDTA